MDYFKDNKCKICGETFTTLRKLIFHIKNVHNIDKKQYLIQYENVNPICPICNKKERFYTNHNSRLFSNTCGNKDCVNEYNKNKIIIYNIKEKSWVEWLTKIFWKKFSNSISE